MRENLDHNLIIKLVEQGYSYKEIVNITGFKKNSVYGFCIKHFGKMLDRNKFRRQILEITQEQKEVLFGQLMGDGSLQKVCNSYQGRINHSKKQEIYCRYKQNLLSSITYSVKEKNDPQYPQVYYCMKPNENLKDLYNMFYHNNFKKDVPIDLSLLTPRAMAIWFMDDGSASGKCSISIATCGFSVEGLIRLQQFLKDTYDLNVIIRKDKKIYFKAESGRKFYRIILPYIINEMMYKFKFINPLLVNKTS